MAITITANTVTAGDTATATQYNDVVTDLNTIAGALDTGGYGVPIGAILPWWAPNSGFALPTGFQVCDGSVIPSGVYAGNNTPDLTSKFMMGTTHSAIGSTSGGSNTKDLSHTHATTDHTLTTSEIPAHQHGIRAEYGTSTVNIAIPGNYNQLTNNIAYGFLTDYTRADGGTGGAHNHGNVSTSLSSSYDIRPAYIGVVYIIRVV